jgi:aminoglycoside phosphotransferase family enzyme/predicted kinase
VNDGPGTHAVGRPSAESEDLVRALLDPAMYPNAPESVELRETHISWVFLAGGLAYKVKKPLVLPFLDYGTIARRHELCRAEVELNRRLAPRIYLGVIGIAREGDRFRLTAESDPTAIEYAVQMRRVEEGRSLAALAVAGTLTAEQITAAARLLARFHATAAVASADRAAVAVLAATLAENVATLRDAGRGLIEPLRLDAMEGFTRAALRARKAELDTRGRTGRVRDCHGDLRAEHVIAPKEGEIYIYDCIEFNPELRQIDVAADLAFLVMDLAALGNEAFGRLLVDRYRQAGGDPGDDPLLFFFAAYRAWVRAKVACLRAAEVARDDPGRRGILDEVGRMIDLGHRFAWRARGPLVLVICGVSATGKTTVSETVHELSGWPHLSSDLTRKQMAGVRPVERGRDDLYSRERTVATYRELGRQASERLRAGDSGVIVDATFHRRYQRDAFRSALRRPDAPVLFVECVTEPAKLTARIRRRSEDAARVSDADERVLERQLSASDPLGEVPRRWRAQLDTDAAPARLAAEIEALVDARVW